MMNNVHFSLIQHVQGQDRKSIAATIASATGASSRYLGPPTFNYDISAWAIRKDGTVHSPWLSMSEADSLHPVLNALNGSGLHATQPAWLDLTYDGLDAESVKNVGFLILSKIRLIQKMFDSPKPPSVTGRKSSVLFSFLPTTLKTNELIASIRFCIQLMALAEHMKAIPPQTESVERDLQEMSQFLLRLGISDSQNSRERGILLSMLEAGFKSETRCLDEH